MDGKQGRMVYQAIPREGHYSKPLPVCGYISVSVYIYVLVCHCISVLSKQYISVASNTQEGPLHSLSTGGRKCVVHMHHKRFDATTSKICHLSPPDKIFYLLRLSSSSFFFLFGSLRGGSFRRQRRRSRRAPRRGRRGGGGCQWAVVLLLICLKGDLIRV